VCTRQRGVSACRDRRDRHGMVRGTEDGKCVAAVVGVAQCSVRGEVQAARRVRCGKVQAGGAAGEVCGGEVRCGACQRYTRKNKRTAQAAEMGSRQEGGTQKNGRTVCVRIECVARWCALVSGAPQVRQDARYASSAIGAVTTMKFR